MMIHDITALVGRHKKRKRVGRGIGSGHGKTCGRGHNGARSRAGAGGSIRSSREGGQMPLFRRISKRGFSNTIFRKQFSVVNIRALDARFDDGAKVNPDILVQVGLVRDASIPVKILGAGVTKKKLLVTAAAFSKAAAEKITTSGGSATLD